MIRHPNWAAQLLVRFTLKKLGYFSLKDLKSLSSLVVANLLKTLKSTIFLLLFYFFFFLKSISIFVFNARIHPLPISLMASKSKSENPHTGDGASPGFVYFSFSICVFPLLGLLIGFFVSIFLRSWFFVLTILLLFFSQEDFHWRFGEGYNLQWVLVPMFNSAENSCFSWWVFFFFFV